MSAIATAVLSGSLALVTAMVTTGWRLRAERRHQSEADLVARLDAYREPLVHSAFELQRRLFTTLNEGFLDAYLGGSDEDAEYALRSTQWLLAQYLGWWEVLRQEIQFLQLGDVAENRRLVQLLDNVSDVLSDDDPELGTPMRIWTAEQRAIGELVLVPAAEDSDRELSCLGYDAFLTAIEDDSRLARRIHQLDNAVEWLGDPNQNHMRAILLQRALVDLIDLLDDDRSRFPIHQRGKLPLGRPLNVREAEELVLARVLPQPQADFVFRDDPWPLIDEWAGHFGFVEVDHDNPFEAKRFFRRRKTSGIQEIVDVARAPENRVRVLAHIVRPWWAPSIRWVAPLPPLVPPDHAGWRLRRFVTRFRADVNVLLQMFDRPLIRPANSRK